VQDTGKTFISSYMRKLPMSEQVPCYLWLVTWLDNYGQHSAAVSL